MSSTKYIEAFGALPSKIDIRDYKASCTAATACLSDFPEAFELEHPAIKNQGNVGSCVAHALASVIEYFNKSQEGTNVKMSTGFIYGNRTTSNYTGSGMYVRDALEAVRKCGTVPNTMMPDNIEVPEAIEKFKEKCADLIADAYQNHITSYYKLADDNAMKACLLKGNPIVFSMAWRSGTYVNSRDNTLVFDKQASISGYHCMYIYGWNDLGWLVANSWGTFYGKKGCFVLPYNAERSETWGVEDDFSETRTAQRFEELKATISDLESKINAAIEERDILMNKIALLEIMVEDSDGEKYRQELETLRAELAEKGNKIDELSNKLVDAERQNYLLREQLLDIEKPFGGTFGKIFAKIVNWICNLIKKMKGKKK